MSGIELAGLVLGAFPLLIYALESYREGAELLNDWWRIQATYKKCKHDLGYHHTIFEGNIERLLLPLVVDDDELKALMDNPAGEAWEDEELEKRLKQRLPKSYELFLDIMGNINKLIESLKKELGVNDSKFLAKVDKGKVKAGVTRRDRLSISNIEFEAKRIRFSLKKSSRERLFDKLQDANDRLRNLLDSSDHISEARRKTGTIKPNSAVNRKINDFWRHAVRLHHALIKSWQCSCMSHVANLQLQHRTSEKVEFDVLFNLGADHKRLGWQETKIKMLPAESTPNSPGIVVKVPQSTPQKSPRKVRWSESSDTLLPTVTQPEAMNIKCLCATLTATSGRLNGAGGATVPECFGYMDEDDYRFSVYPGDPTKSISGYKIVTLEKILSDAHGILTRRKRYWLALTLASSYLQLSSTPWLTTPLQKENVLFLHDPKNDESVLLDTPYLCGEMSKSGATDTVDTMAALGIRLLELCFGTSLEQNKFRQQLPAGDATSAPLLDYAAALNWSKLVTEEAGPEFAQAVEWCLRAKQLSDGSWRKDIWTHVIGPLEYCYKQVSARITAY
ncbi:hypothetical protein BU24DRAFT_467859 [Aaosphaeria arxii CBS 175.79]|uniref:DUF7580 domain-containing protein n=1 Tax=Aaosphaeria arxii CBS 175.79 TaxID=1450172 RepID=A0A6A5X9C1_9PLEO|nr:uncharacterized protein BU24DRAFT_467859 [Aaosphaeria arxii CBS 175.79]KAF2009486.1 hypothetical protein BU24DRAFT_467859 [Aaosphaeria arxii CBS 175.79]